MRLFTAIVFLLFSISTNAANATLNWTFDNSATATCAGSTAENPLPAATWCPLTGFQVQELSNGIWTTKSAAVNTSLRTLTYPNVPPGRHCYRLIAVSNGTNSAPSTESCIDIPTVAPKAPTITVTITVSTP